MGEKDDKEYIEYENGKRVLLDEDDSPEWTEEMFKNAKKGRKSLEEILGKKNAAELISGIVIMKPIGRPKKKKPKIKTTIRLDQDLLEAYRSHGRGWQTEINNLLRECLENRP
jgi:uncharacterized protein (DUF4415 family)